MSSAIDWIWDINDSDLVEVANTCGGYTPNRCRIQEFEMWPNGNCRLMYSSASESARRHLTGWAMRNTNNHNAEILKKSCLGVLVCSMNCLKDGRRILIRPAICDIARKKQLGLPCPNQDCGGQIVHLACKGNGGYPVTHFWRQINKAIFFQAKGAHDHARPEFKTARKMNTNTNTSTCVKRARLTEVDEKPPISVSTLSAFTSPKKDKKQSARLRKDKSSKASVDLKRKADNGQKPRGDSAVCSCPPFECTCKTQQSEHEFWNRMQQTHNTAALANRMFLRSLSCDAKPLMHVNADCAMFTDFYSPQVTSGATQQNAASHSFYSERNASPHSTGYSDEENYVNVNSRAYLRQTSAPLNAYVNWLQYPEYLMRCANANPAGQIGMQMQMQMQLCVDERSKGYPHGQTVYGNNNTVCATPCTGTPSSPVCPVIRYPSAVNAAYFPLNGMTHYSAEQASM